MPETPWSAFGGCRAGCEFSQAVAGGGRDAVLDPGVGAVTRVEPRDVEVGLVGEERGEPVAVDVVEGLLRAGVQRFAAHHQP